MDQRLLGFFDALWTDFTAIAPAAASIKQALQKAGETIVNDHVAFRTFDRGPLKLDALEPHLLALGYRRYAPYFFEAKKLRAFGYVHDAPDAPKVFASELCIDALPTAVQQILDRVIAQIPPDAALSQHVFTAGRLWEPISYADWTVLAAHSEYAAWLCAHGMHANHFTISVNALSPALRSVAKVNDFVEALGFAVNASGGRVKGSPQDLLEQASTMADQVDVAFADGMHKVPSCYYEFALRHAMPNGELYPGFVAASADKIFESTDTRQLASH